MHVGPPGQLAQALEDGAVVGFEDVRRIADHKVERARVADPLERGGLGIVERGEAETGVVDQRIGLVYQWGDALGARLEGVSVHDPERERWGPRRSKGAEPSE